ncbi:MAG: hypothetical protein ACYTXT_40515 [Nostoc sp.]
MCQKTSIMFFYHRMILFWRCLLNNIGVVYNIQAKYSQAETNLFAAIEVWELLRAKLKDDQKISIFEQQAKTYRFLQETFIAQNKIEQALETSERGRARAFIDLLTSKSTPNKASIFFWVKSSHNNSIHWQ